MARLRAWCASPLFKPTRAPRRTSGSVVQSIMNRERSIRPTSRRAAASSFWRGDAASLRRSWLGRMVPAAMMAATPQDVRPVAVEQVHVHLAADQRAQVLRDARAFEHVEALRAQVPDARAERVAEDRARGEVFRTESWERRSFGESLGWRLCRHNGPKLGGNSK